MTEHDLKITGEVYGAGMVETHDYYNGASYAVRLARFVLNNQWYWREQWLGCSPSIWQGPFPTREAAEVAAGVTR